MCACIYNYPGKKERENPSLLPRDATRFSFSFLSTITVDELSAKSCAKFFSLCLFLFLSFFCLCIQLALVRIWTWFFFSLFLYIFFVRLAFSEPRRIQKNNAPKWAARHSASYRMSRGGTQGSQRSLVFWSQCAGFVIATKQLFCRVVQWTTIKRPIRIMMMKII